MLSPETIHTYVDILREELVPATGCTEPIAIAYAAALLRQTLGAAPERVLAEVSGNIIKNVKSVIVPNTGGLKGIQAAVAAGVVAGRADQILQVISDVPEDKLGDIARYAKETPIQVECAHTPRLLDIVLTGWAGDHTALVHIADSHSNVVRVERDGQVLREKALDAAGQAGQERKMSVEDILAFAREVDLGLVSDLLDRQIEYNSAIAAEGLSGDWGANIGSVLLGDWPADIKTEAKAWAAAGSDARMSGCEMPVVILSGSGNQGITASVPVIVYARELGLPQEKLYRALVVSNLTTIHLKQGIGPLSAYCGAISAGCGAAAGITYLLGGGYEQVAHTVVNAIAINSGVICDGAKASCAAKIASAVEAGLLGMEMYRQGSEFVGGDGIVSKGVERTIRNVYRLAAQGMRLTDSEIISIMLSDQQDHCS